METRAPCFSNSFWGHNDLGVGVLLDRMTDAKSTNEEIRQFYKERASIEDEYARKLSRLAKTSLGASEIGTLRTALDVLKSESSNMAKSHASIAAQLKSDLEEPHTAFSDTLREKRKIISTTVEKLFRTKVQQQVELKRSKERRDSDYLKANGCLAQQNLLLGRELERNNAKLEKVQTSMQTSSVDYENAIRQLSETIDRWNREWTKACDQFQNLEEERIENMKTGLWSYANILSQVCVTDDEACERLRLSLEKCDVSIDIRTFIETKGTGTEIPGAPKLAGIHQTRNDQSDDANLAMGRSDMYNNPRDEIRTNVSYRNGPRGEYDDRNDVDVQDNGKVINQFPLDGITQLCRSDSAATYASASNSLVNSNIASSSVYSSVPGSQRHTPSGSLVSQQPPQKLSRRKSFIDKVDLWPRRSPSPSKGMETIKPLKAQKTGSSIFDALRPARSRSRAGFRADSPVSVVGEGSEINGRSDNRLNIGHNMFPVNLQSQQITITPNSVSSDPIALALEKLTLESEGPRPHAANGYPESRDAYRDVSRLDRLPSSAQRPHRRVPSRSEPTSPTSELRSMATAKPHPNVYSSQHAPSGTLFAPPAAHSASEMRQTADQYSRKNASVLQGDPDINYQQSLNHATRSRSRASSFHSSHSRQAPGDLRRSPSPKPTSQSDHRADRSPRRQKSGSLAQTLRRSPSPQPIEPRQESAYFAHTEQRTRSFSNHTNHGDNQNKVNEPQSRQESRRSEQYYHSRRDDVEDARVQNVTSQQHRTSRPRSKSFAETSRPQHRSTSDGREILAYVMALYDYQATIPEEIGFRQGDTLAIVEMREDGWWLGEVTDQRQPRRGLVPSNFFRRVDDPRKITVSTMS